MRTPLHLFLVSALVLSAGVFFSEHSQAQSAKARSIVFNGNTYYVVDGNNPALDSGNEACASVGMKFNSYKSINTNGVCKALHPTAKEVTSVNGSKAGFYCNGLPQKGLACEKFKNTCQVCPACNLNEAADGKQTIGGHFAEMFVWCDPVAKSSAKSGQNLSGRPASMPGGNKLSSSSRTSVRSSSSRTSSMGPAVTCTFSQSPKKVSCGAVKAADSFCVISMGNAAAKATACSDTGNVVCSLPCTAPNAVNFNRCATGGRLSGSCPRSSAPSGRGTKKPGELCANGGECNTGYCLGVIPGREYRCSCHMFNYVTSCLYSSSSSLPATNRAPGALCDHGGHCQSGMCLGVVPGREYRCSCNDPKTRWQSCVR